VTERLASRWYQRISLRTRVLIISSVAVAVVVAIGGILLIAMVRGELIDTADDIGEDMAEDYAVTAQAGELPRTLERVGDEPPSAQVVQNGRIISQTSDSMGNRPYVDVELEPGTKQFLDREKLPIDEDGPFRLVALGTSTPSGPATIFVAVDVEDIDEALTVTRDLGSLGLIGIVLVLSGVLWVVIGRTLAPVAAIRERADAITGSELHRRVPEPVGGDEISDLARTINAMLGRLESSAKRQEAFVADAAHELRSPIASLQARLETELLSTRTAAGDVMTRDLLRETIRMGRLVEHLLLLARSDAGTISADKVPVDMDEVVRESVKSVGDAVVPITTDEVEPVQVMGQPALLEHVVSNLLDNAGRYADSSIHVSLHANDRHAILTVDDDGPGIPEDLRDDVFERFVRVDMSRERGTGGAGLGLAIVSEIVRVHEGEIEITDSPAGGARVRVLLPLD
jgi:signal transduction histidine kinase